METGIALIGFGEAATAFSEGGRWASRARAYDRKTDRPAERDRKRADYAAHAVAGCDTPADAIDGAEVILSLVTADQALAAAGAAAEAVGPGVYFFDGNSVAPETKKAAAQIVGARGGHYIDMAIMAPVLPGRLAVPILLAGPEAQTASEMLGRAGFTDVTVAGDRVGDASAVKMIRSVVVKGMEALAAECLLAASRAGVTEAVLASLDASWKTQGWAERMDYSLDRMLAHGLRRAAEMEEAASTLAELGIDAAMTRGTVARQRALGELAIAPPAGLGAKLAAIEASMKDIAA